MLVYWFAPKWAFNSLLALIFLIVMKIMSAITATEPITITIIAHTGNPGEEFIATYPD